MTGTPSETTELIDTAERIGLNVAHIRTVAMSEHFTIMLDTELAVLKTDLVRARRTATRFRGTEKKRRILHEATKYPILGFEGELIPVSIVNGLVDRIALLTGRVRGLRARNRQLTEQVQKLTDANVQRWLSPHPETNERDEQGKEAKP